MRAQEILDRLAPVRGYQEAIVTPRRVEVLDPAGAAVLHDAEGREWPLSPALFSTLAGRVGIPEKLAERTPPAVLAPVLEYHLGRGAPLRVVSRGDTVHGVSDARIPWLPLERAVELTVGAIAVELDVFQAYPEPEEAVVILVGPHREPVGPGDVVQAGIGFSVSPLGVAAPEVWGHVVRLVCSNGATAGEEVARFRGYDGEDMGAWWQERVREAYFSLESTVEHYRQLAERRLADGEEAINRTLRHFRIPQDIRTQVLERAAGAETMYDLLNIVTEVGTHNPDIRGNRRRFRRMMDMAGHLASRRVCEACNRPLR